VQVCYWDSGVTNRGPGMPGNIPDPTRIVHMTHVNNLGAIFEREALVATASLIRGGTDFTNIAYSSIQAQRAAKRVPCGPGGCLHDYVPFYFTHRSPMLYTINRGNVPCEGGQGALVHLVSTAQRVAAAGLGFAFSDGHGIMSYSNFYDDLAHLGEVDWDVIRSRQWSDTVDDGDRKRRKQAEFLVHDEFSTHLIRRIVVRTAGRGQEVAEILQQHGVNLRVDVDASWYY